MTPEELRIVLEAHKKWVNREGGERAVLRGADLQDAALHGADLQGANLQDVKVSTSTSHFFMCCPQEGSYVGFKKAVAESGGSVLIKLLIPDDAKRSSATSRKCRASKALVLSMERMDGTPYCGVAYSVHDSTFDYITGELVEVADFDPDRWLECAPGIHHFITKEEAILYVL